MTSNGLTVAITGPTGDIGRALVRALEKNPEIERIVGMARRPLDPSGVESKFEYLQGDMGDRAAVNKLVAGADVVVHLAFVIFGGDDSRAINLEGARNVFEAAVESGAKRLVYTSSVAAYGFHEDNPDLLTEDVYTRGTENHPYSAEKAAVEKLLAETTRYFKGDVFVFRPCIVAGPTALSLIERIPYIQFSEKLPESVKKLAGSLPVLRPIIPDPGVPFQLVHEDDVADALVAAILGKGEPGVYNLSADGEISLSELAHALGWYSIPIPDVAVDATVKIVSRLPLLPIEAKWINAIQVPMLMDCTRAKRKLGWEPRHDALETLAETIQAARDKGLLLWRPSLERNA